MMPLDEIPHNFATARLEDVVRWGRRNSVFPATFGLACCAIELIGTGAAHYDIARFGMEVFRASPRQADLMIVAGRVAQKMAPVLRQVYDQMVEPKWVISMGVCASTGGMFNNYAIVQGVDQIVPVDVYVPGCPPGPETLMHGILTLHEQIRTGELLRRREASPSGGAGIELGAALEPPRVRTERKIRASQHRADPIEEHRLRRSTSEGAQELQPQTRTDEIVIAGSGMWLEDPLDNTMVVNMGPQHPSTHGVLRLMLELDGEDVRRIKPVIGYLHTGMEKTGEELTYVQGVTNVTRMDYVSPLSNELVYSMAVERLLDVDIPPRATWIRMLLNELNRAASHLLFQATNGLDLGALSMIIYGWREREEVLRYLEYVTGLRMNNNFIRPGGVAADLPDGWQERLLDLCDMVERGVAEYDELLSQNPIWRERTVGIGTITTDECLARSITGPILRSTGFAWDLRKAQPYLAYDEVEFDIVYATNGDVFDRYRIRLGEILESLKIVRQCVEHMPAGDYRVQDKKVTPPPRARINESMEALIHHFKLFTEGFKVPPGETYVAVESPRGEIGCYMVSDGTGKPVRMHIRAPSLYNLQGIEPMSADSLVADAIAVVSSIDPILGEVDR
jgi:NADH-quinone oxidoreductase subunit D